jgi:hypothetical protein
MSLLDEIQTAAAADAISLSSVLRKCQILAARLGYKPLKDWVEMESNGYQAGMELPHYRIKGQAPLQLVHREGFALRSDAHASSPRSPVSLHPKNVQRNPEVAVRLTQGDRRRQNCDQPWRIRCDLVDLPNRNADQPKKTPHRRPRSWLAPGFISRKKPFLSLARRYWLSNSGRPAARRNATPYSSEYRSKHRVLSS